MSDVQLDLPFTPETEPTPEPPKTKPVTINGTEYSVPVDLADALEQREREFQRKLSEQAAELSRQWAARAPAQEAPKHEDPLEGVETLLFENPKEAVKRLRESIVSQVSSMYEADQGRKQFWADFYADYPELRKHQTIVDAVLNQHINEWASLPANQAKQLLANEVKREIVEIAKTIAPSGNRTYTEEQRQPKARPVASETPAPPKSLTQLLRERRSKMHPAVPVA